MFGENLKTLRQQKGMSQEALAQQLNVVRQTISKWEKGLSVPDATMLSEIAEFFEVPVSDLLGSKIEKDENINEIAAQLALLNEQLANRSRRNRRLIRGILIGIAAVIVAYILIIVLSFASFSVRMDNGTNLTEYHAVYTIDGVEHDARISYDEHYRIATLSLDSELFDELNAAGYDDARELSRVIEEYVHEQGGTVEILVDIP